MVPDVLIEDLSKKKHIFYRPFTACLHIQGKDNNRIGSRTSVRSRFSTRRFGRERASIDRWELGHVKPGRLINGDRDPDRAREERGPADGGLDAVPGIPPLTQPPPPFPSPEPPWLGLDDEMDAEAQLQVYLDRAKGPKQKGFPPMEVLSARLNEFTAPPHRAEAFPGQGGIRPGPTCVK